MESDGVANTPYIEHYEKSLTPAAIRKKMRRRNINDKPHRYKNNEPYDTGNNLKSEYTQENEEEYNNDNNNVNFDINLSSPEKNLSNNLGSYKNKELGVYDRNDIGIQQIGAKLDSFEKDDNNNYNYIDNKKDLDENQVDLDLDNIVIDPNPNDNESVKNKDSK